MNVDNNFTNEQIQKANKCNAKMCKLTGSRENANLKDMLSLYTNKTEKRNKIKKKNRENHCWGQCREKDRHKFSQYLGKYKQGCFL